jgi:hypothetical protein
MLVLLLASGCLESPEFEEPEAFSTVYEEVLMPSCAFSSCHGGGAGGLDLSTEDGAYDSLVDVESEVAAGWIRVLPGSADDSYLVAKMEGADGISGDTMPPGSVLDEETTQRVRDWIDAGAPRD